MGAMFLFFCYLDGVTVVINSNAITSNVITYLCVLKCICNIDPYIVLLS